MTAHCPGAARVLYSPRTRLDGAVRENHPSRSVVRGNRRRKHTVRILAELKHKEGMALAHEGCEGDMHFWAILDLPEDWQSDDSIRRVVESYDKGKWPSCAEHMDWGSLKITRHKEPHDLEVENAALRARLAKYE